MDAVALGILAGIFDGLGDLFDADDLIETLVEIKSDRADAAIKIVQAPMGGRDRVAKGIVKQFCAEGGSLKKGLDRELEADGSEAFVEPMSAPYLTDRALSGITHRVIFKPDDPCEAMVESERGVLKGICKPRYCRFLFGGLGGSRVESDQMFSAGESFAQEQMTPEARVSTWIPSRRSIGC